MRPTDLSISLYLDRIEARYRRRLWLQGLKPVVVSDLGTPNFQRAIDELERAIFQSTFPTYE